MQSTLLLIDFSSVVDLFGLHMDLLWLLTLATNWWDSHFWDVESDREWVYYKEKTWTTDCFLATFSRNNFTNPFHHECAFACQDSLTVKICTLFKFSKTTTLEKKIACKCKTAVLYYWHKKSWVKEWSATTTTQSTIHLDLISMAVNNRNNGGFRWQTIRPSLH